MIKNRYMGIVVLIRITMNHSRKGVCIEIIIESVSLAVKESLPYRSVYWNMSHRTSKRSEIWNHSRKGVCIETKIKAPDMDRAMQNHSRKGVCIETDVEASI